MMAQSRKPARYGLAYTRTLNDGSEHHYGTNVVNNYLGAALPHEVAAKLEAVMRYAAQRNFPVAFAKAATS